MERRRPFASRARLAGVVLLVLVAASACGDHSPIGRDDAVATVNGHDITLHEVEEMVDAQTAYYRASLTAARKAKADADSIKGLEETLDLYTGDGAGTLSTAGAAQAISTLTDVELLQAEATKAKAEVTAEDRKALRAQLKEQVKGQGITITKAMGPLVDAEVERAALTAALAPTGDYEAKLQQAFVDQKDGLDKLCVDLVVTADEKSSRAAFARVEAGEDFGAVAADVSIDETSAAAKGAAGCVPKDALANVFGATTYDAGVGDRLGPADGQGSWLFVQVTGAQEATYEESRETLAQQIPDDSQQKATDLLAKARKKAKITVDPRYGTWDAEQGIVVVPGDPGATTTTAASFSTVDPSAAPAGADAPADTTPTTAGS